MDESSKSSGSATILGGQVSDQSVSERVWVVREQFKKVLSCSSRNTSTVVCAGLSIGQLNRCYLDPCKAGEAGADEQWCRWMIQVLAYASKGQEGVPNRATP